MIKAKFLNSGYTLIELSVSITIIAILVTGGMTVIVKQDEIDKRNRTIEKIDVIENAIQSFVDFNGFIPCPAAGNSLNADAAFGISAAYDSNTQNCSELTGMVPVRTLNLNDNYAFDSWNWKFSYRIATGMGSSDHFVDPNYLGDLKIIDLKGNEKTSTTLSENRNYGAAYVIISHGPNGAGAWVRNTTLQPDLPTGTELENLNHTINTTYIQDATTSQYDDITAYKTLNELDPPKISEAPIVLSSDICSNAESIVIDGPPSTTGEINPLGEFINLNPSAYEDLANQYYQSAVTLKYLCDNPPISYTYPTPWPATLSLSDIDNGDGSLGFSVYGSSNNDNLGDAISEIGDINNDGISDFAIATTGNSSSGTVHIIFGTENQWPAESDVTIYSSSSGTKGVTLFGTVDSGLATGDFIASIGDINNDELDDFFISSPQETSRNAGGYVLFGRSDTTWSSSINLDAEIAGGSGTFGFRIVLEDTNHNIVSVGGQGDINGDGINDVVIGANIEGTSDEGKVYVIFGASNFSNPTIAVTTLNGTNGVELAGVSANDAVGSAVAIGDVNGDGFSDVIIGATGIENADSETTGGAYAVFGKATWTSPFNLGSVNGSNGFKFIADNGQTGNMNNTLAGQSISSKDLDQDGFDDILIGAPNAYNATLSDRSGESYLLFGASDIGSSGISILASDLNGILGTILRGEQVSEEAGHSVAIIEDVNGDSINDLLIGAPNKQVSSDNTGVVYLLFGRSASYNWESLIELSILASGDGSQGTEIQGTNDLDRTGTYVADAADLDKDGYNDLAIGSPEAENSGNTDNGRGYIIFGH